MAASTGTSLRRHILLTPHCHFLMATRRAFNEMLGLDSQHDKGWEIVKSPRDPAPPGESQGEETGNTGEAHFQLGYFPFEGHGSDDSEATVHYPVPPEAHGEEHPLGV